MGKCASATALTQAKHPDWTSTGQRQAQRS